MRAVVVDRSAQGGLTVAAVAEPKPLPSEALVRVAAVSLNLGEVRRTRDAADGWRPGWDFAGTVERGAADGHGPHEGARVVGMLRAGAWAEKVAVPARNLAIVPASVDFARASTLPIAGLTALYALELRGSLLGRRVLITGASGGVGVFATQLARRSGAHVTALVHRPERKAVVAPFADVVVVGEAAGVAHETGPFDVILESVGGEIFAGALRELAEDGLLVTFGTSANPRSTIDVASFYSHGGCSIYGFIIFHELERRPAGVGLARLVGLVDARQLAVHIDDVVPIEAIGEAAERLWNRSVPGKLVATF